ncbi:restriction endonuclease subunit S [Rhodanobacter lindaniclasticus]|uniref:Type I restriction modification DNA specificity domain-containing protein n=1 Tax=Rhodanobacter lindaniclasticus TaxID=75310 RepID=A0A4S3KNH3_9GAMM|nr:restriction endonuclease subunit S [Rhodanobacter lindaniclasticus]THD09654.1 hypothetical protein B1991_01840 [Rhodanobacter lindaniclasticus]
MTWATIPLAKAADLESGFGFPREHQGEFNQSVPFFRVSDMNLAGNEVYMANHSNTVSRATLAALHARTFPAGTVIFPKIGAAIGTEKKRILTKPSTYDNNVMGAVPKDGVAPKFLYYWFLRINLTEYANASHVPSIRKSVMEEIPFPLPAPSEQRRIVEILDQADALRGRAREADVKAARILPALFLKMFGDPTANPMGWPTADFFGVFDDVTAGHTKVQARDFQPSGAVPIVDQGQNYVAGYTDDKSIAHKDPLPVIVFGDHTRTFKYVDFPFALGADGVRVLSAKDGIDPLFAYWHCRLRELPSAGYSRHFKYLKEKRFMRPAANRQSDFARAASETTKLTAAIGTATEKVEKLFTLLLQRAFSGQLTAKWRETHMQELLAEMQEQALLLNLPTSAKGAK